MAVKVQVLYFIFYFTIWMSQLGVAASSSVTTEEVMILNGSRVEITTVKIAEISNHHSHHHHYADQTTFLKAVTARHFVATTTKKPRVILIPSAHYKAQIRRRLKNAYDHKNILLSLPSAIT
jgi:predicted nucleotidyltransferase